MTTVTQIAAELADREAIRDCLMRYSRGIDRLDAELLKSVYWPDSVDDHVGFVGSGPEFIDYVVSVLATMDQTVHLLGNILIEIDSIGAANTETYFQAFHRLRGADERRNDLVVGGRYVDRLEKRSDEWRLAQRLVILDWFREYQDSADWSALPLGLQVKPGGRKPNDRSYERLGKRGEVP
jgi:SnoaL-like domain